MLRNMGCLPSHYKYRPVSTEEYDEYIVLDPLIENSNSSTGFSSSYMNPRYVTKSKQIQKSGSVKHRIQNS